MRLPVVLAVPVLALLACTSGAGHGSASTPANTGSLQPHATTQATTPFADWDAYHGNRGRTGVSTTMPAFTGHLSVVKNITLDGAVYASPLVVGGHVIVATENDTVYNFTSTGTLVWKKHVGSPAQQSELPCGNIFPLGITGTPVYYRGLVYVVAELGNPVRHGLFALRLSTGAQVWKRSLDYSGVSAAAMQERGALTTEGGRIWVPFGGLAGDCSNYKGRLVGILSDGTGSGLVYTVPTTREAGMWTPPGPSVDPHGWIYASVGNGAAGTGDPYDHSDSVLKLDATRTVRDFFAPSSWASDNNSDADLGSQGPALVGSSWVFIAGKSGTAYVLSQSHLGGIGGQVSSASLCTSFGGTAVVGSSVYVPCTDGVRKVTISGTGTMSVNWHASVHGSPVVGAGRVWSIDSSAGVLHALSTSTGASTAQISVGATARFATPALWGRLVVVPTLAGVTIVSES